MIQCTLNAQSLKDSWIEEYNVAWTKPSRDFTGSMPTGNGDVGLNVWVEKNGDIFLLIGKTDSFDENANLVKPAGMRLHITPAPFATDSSFKQILRLNQSAIEIKSGKWLELKLWVDANHPVVHIEAKGKQDFILQVIPMIWRTSIRQLEKTQVSDLYHNLYGPNPYPTYIYPDTIVKQSDRVYAYHKNQTASPDGYAINMQLQGLGGYEPLNANPLRDRIFGVAFQGKGFRADDQFNLQSIKPAKNQSVEIYALTIQPANQETWIAQMDQLIDHCDNIEYSQAWARHLDWWNKFWSCSRIDIRNSKGTHDQGWEVARGYNMSRYLNACAGRGSWPVKFNGSIFSYGIEGNPDYRQWGGCGFWHQNQRLIYWPMLAQGDYDLMLPWFSFYKNMLPLAKYRTKKYFNHGGAFFPETVTPWGTDISAHYGWTPYESRKNPLDECTYITYHFQSGLEQTLMMYEYFSYTGDTAFALNYLMPFATEIMLFYDQHYRLDNHGKMHIGPAQALETYQVALNPMPEIAGLSYTLGKLLTLPSAITTEATTQLWQSLYHQIPPLPSAEINGKKKLAPAMHYDMLMNVENPELYAVFPYRIYGVGKDDIETGRNTYVSRKFREDKCWYQNVVDAALLGLTDSARIMVTQRVAPEEYSKSRFPAFWDAHNDWIPDVDHGGNLQIALNYMLMQCEGLEIRLLPAWPGDWDVDFKLHAPLNTTVECVYRNHRIEKLKVIPEERAKDVILPNTIQP